MIHLRFRLEDCHTCFIVRLVNINRDTTFKTGTDSFIQRLQLLWRLVGRKNNLFLIIIKFIKRIEKFRLCTLFFDDKLNVINQQDVHISVFFTEFICCMILDRVDNLMCKCLRWYIQNFRLIILLQDVMCDGLHEMRLSKSGVSI